jgi:E-phenylitaconyl-CoA hydratase
MSIDYVLDETGIATVTINRPDRLNALDNEHYSELSRTWIEVRDNPAVRCVIITGAGEKSFCAGADIKAVVGQKVELWEIWRSQQTPLINRGLEIWKPVVAAVNGYCLGGGMTLLLATDIRVAVPHAEFGVPEVKRGIIAGMGGTQRVVRQLPHALAMELLLTGERVDSDWALRAGLINKVAPSTDLMATARRYAESIASNAPLAVQATKELALRARDTSLVDGMRMEQFTNTLLEQLSLDVQEGRTAFLKKRDSSFQGR